LNASEILAETLAPPQRLALAYAPRADRPAWLAVLALDARLAEVVRQAREPLIGQIRLAWWRERLAEDASAWPAGEPLLAALRSWRGGHGALGPMVDGWEVLLGEAPLDRESLSAAVEGRAAGLVAVAVHLGHRDRAEAVRSLARRWVRADLAVNLSDPRERAVLAALAVDEERVQPALPRALRPLVVLEGFSRHGPPGLVALLRALRLGILGR
jgi:phytoene synthase